MKVRRIPAFALAFIIALGIAVQGTYAAVFGDVTEGSHYFEAVNTLADAGIISGTGGGAFNPGADMTNAMAVTMLYNHAGKPAASAGSNEWYAVAAAWAADNSIIGADADMNAPIDAAVFSGYLAAYAASAGLGSPAQWVPGSGLTRGEAAEQMYVFYTQNAA